jgi:hypothetical protein
MCKSTGILEISRGACSLLSADGHMWRCLKPAKSHLQGLEGTVPGLGLRIVSVLKNQRKKLHNS